MGNILIVFIFVIFALSLLQSPKVTTTEAPPPDANYVFKKEKSTQPSSEPVVTKTNQELLVQCKQEYELAKLIMTNRQMNMPMIKSLEKIYNDPQFSEELKSVAKNAVAIAEDEDRYAIQSKRTFAINSFAKNAEKDCLKFN